mgnify:FL=1
MTFLEKAFLLNEEFQKEKPRSRRMSRHLYDLEKLMDTNYGKAALEDTALYQAIVEHRRKFYQLFFFEKVFPDLRWFKSIIILLITIGSYQFFADFANLVSFQN